MTTPSVIPALSQDGWVTSTAQKADYLISHFFLSEYSQSLLYAGNVASFQWIIQNNQGDMLKTNSTLRETLRIYFSRYFSEVVVESNYVETPENSGRVRITLYVSFKDHEGKEFVLSRLVEILDTKIEKVLKLNNTESV
jgi:hypothetical protein